METANWRNLLSEFCLMSARNQSRNRATQRGRKCDLVTSPHRVSQFYLFLFAALSLYEGCSGSMLSFTGPRGTTWLGSARNNAQRLDAAKLKWLNALQETDSDDSETVSDKQQLSPVIVQPRRISILQYPWTQSTMRERPDSLTGSLPEFSSNRLGRLENLVAQWSDNYLPEKPGDEFYTGDIWLGEGPVNGEMGRTVADQANLVVQNPLKRAETHYKERLARLT